MEGRNKNAGNVPGPRSACMDQSKLEILIVNILQRIESDVEEARMRVERRRIALVAPQSPQETPRGLEDLKLGNIISEISSTPSPRQRGKGGGSKAKAPEPQVPLVDVFEEGDYIKVVMELPDVQREEVSVYANGRGLAVKVRGRTYREVKLPSAVDPNSVTFTLNNGILTVNAKKAAR